nr:S26 family signal peptidase [Actinoplanes derwentensis]
MLAAVVVLRRVRRRHAVVRVTGSSMAPTFRPGDRVLVRRTVAGVRTGDVVAVEAPEQGRWPTRPLSTGIGGRRWLIKRVAAVAGEPVPATGIPALAGERIVPDGFLVLLGDAGEISYDSKQVGYFPAARVLGVAVRLLDGYRQRGEFRIEA